MSIKSIMTGFSVAAAAGYAAFQVSSKAEKQKKKLKSKAGKALRAIGDVVEDLKSMTF
ncbi:MAG: hypothetical protein IJ645_08470 [Ruminococcus sp.]|nr:hypothetical protein [Ruminococcus sp.]